MARTNANEGRVKPVDATLGTMHVLRRERISPSFARVTLGGGDVAAFRYLGFDQWFRLFLPVSEASLSRLPATLDTFAYLRYLAIAKTDRPVLRNYTVRAYRPDGPEGPELDVDFVLHGSAAEGTSGPAATWAETCAAGDAVGILDEGLMCAPPADRSSVAVLVGDETAVPAAMGILESMPRDARGTAYLEIPHPDDRQSVDAPEGVDVRWIVREDAAAVPGAAALSALVADALPAGPFYAWAAGEQALAAGARRHWVSGGVPKNAIRFCGYWKARRH
ncbi:siderophore-interacting protein [Microbacterium sp. RD1]|uniref:siderophore-interacting protein n=1 Tax=Microbacterium sp. RD1 TaxID=3457313 RepID=UPI003FA560EF